MGTHYLRYQLDLYSSAMADASLLEETRPGAIDPIWQKRILEINPMSLIDKDGDGLREVSASDLEKAYSSYIADPDTQNCHFNLFCGMNNVSFPLATYFNDEKKVGVGDRLKDLPWRMRVFTREHDFEKARHYFTGEYARTPHLEKLAERLALHLSATAVHVGTPFAEYAPLFNEYGFSPTRDGYLRFNCTTFIQLAHSDLLEIPGLTFTYVYHAREAACDSVAQKQQTSVARVELADYVKTHAQVQFGEKAKESNPDGSSVKQSTESRYTHVTLIISSPDAQLVVDNDRVTVLSKQTDALAYVVERWSSTGLSKIFSAPTFESVIAKASSGIQ